MNDGRKEIVRKYAPVRMKNLICTCDPIINRIEFTVNSAAYLEYKFAYLASVLGIVNVNGI